MRNGKKRGKKGGGVVTAKGNMSLCREERTICIVL